MKTSMLAVKVLLCVIGTGVVFGNVEAIDKNDKDLRFSQSITVTATRNMKDIKEVPSAISVVTAEDIAARNVHTVADALQMLPSVYKSQIGNGGIQIRGVKEQDILLLVNGVPMNNTFNNSIDWEMIPIQTIERIELVKGAGSSLYGGRAVAAVINITMKTTSKEDEIGTVYADASMEYGTHSTWKKSVSAMVRASEKWSGGISYEHRSTNGFPGYYYVDKGREIDNKATNLQTPDKELPTLSSGKYILGSRGDKEFDNKTFSAFVKYDITDDQKMSYRFTHATSTYLYARPFSNVFVNGEEQFSGNIAVGQNQYISLSPKTFLGYDGLREYNQHALSYEDEKNKISIQLGLLDKTKDGYSSPANPGKIEYTGRGKDSFYPGKTYNFDFQKIWSTLGKHTVVAGVNLKQESFDQVRRDLMHWRDHKSYDTTKYAGGIDQRNEGKTRNMAVFVQDEYRMNEKVLLYTGLRFDYFKKFDGHSYFAEGLKSNAAIKDVFHESRTYTECSPKLALEYYMDDNTNVYISYGHSFNPPRLSRVYRYDPKGMMGGVIANPDLAPEKTDTFEIGLKKFIGDTTSFDISIFNMKTKDKEMYAKKKIDGNTVKQYINGGDEEHHGVEVSMKRQMSDSWSTYVNYTWQSGNTHTKAILNTNIKDGTEHTYDIPRHLFHAGVQYTKGKWNVLLDTQYVSERQAADVVTGEYQSEDSYFIMNTFVNYEIQENMNLQLGVENLFDRQFYASEKANGRQLHVGMNYHF